MITGFKSSILAATLLAATPLAAQAHPDRTKLDANGDGSVDFAEMQAAKADFTVEQFNKADANGDGLLSRDDMRRLRPLNVSMGLMLETVAERLRGRGEVHQWAPDKEPRLRLAMLEEAGELRIPFTTGLLLGIGETLAERVDTLLAIHALHRRHGHIQEVIVQSFRAQPGMPMRHALEPGDAEVAQAIALARLILDDEVAVQAPPNLNSKGIDLLLRAGVSDFGGISPVTPDYINPGHPWPHVDVLREACARSGFVLMPRLPIYGVCALRPGFVAGEVARAVQEPRA